MENCINASSLNKLCILYDAFHHHKEDCGILHMEIDTDPNKNSLLGFSAIRVEQPKFNVYMRDTVINHPMWKLTGNGKPIEKMSLPTHAIYEIMRRIGIKPVKHSRGPPSAKKKTRDFLCATMYYYNSGSFDKNMHRLFINFRLPSHDKPYLQSLLAFRLNEMIASKSKEEKMHDKILPGDRIEIQDCSTKEFICCMALIDLFNKGTDADNLNSNNISVLSEQIKKYNIDISTIQLNVHDCDLLRFMDCLLHLTTEEKNNMHSVLNSNPSINLTRAKKICSIRNIISFLKKRDLCKAHVSADPIHNSPLFGWNRIQLIDPFPFILICKIFVLSDYNSIWLRPNGIRQCKNPSWVIYNLLRVLNIKPYNSISQHDNTRSSKSYDMLYFKEWLYYSR